MSYCLNPYCQKPDNLECAEVCQIYDRKVAIGRLQSLPFRTIK